MKLQELGFDESCFGYYTPMKDWMLKGKYSDGNLHFHGPNWANNDNTMYFMYVQNSFGDRDSITKNSKFTKAVNNVAAPLYQQVIDWFREKHNIVSEIWYDNTQDDDFPWLYEIYINNKAHEHDGSYYDTFQEAREQSILKAIELIN